MRVLINAANLRVGGGVQVASSFLDELARLREDSDALSRFPWLVSGLRIQASSEVLANTRAGTTAALGVREHTTRFDVSALGRRKADVAFCVFGPEYVPARARHRIVGFADVTSLFPEQVPGTFGHPARQRLRRRVSKSLFRQVDTVVVEAPHVAQHLISRWGIDPDRLHIVPNTLHSVFHEPDTWEPSPLERLDDRPHVVFVTRGYPHKNLASIALVGDELERLGHPMRFVLTLHDDEWHSLPDHVRRHSMTVGPVSVRQLGELYRSCDASFFPSLLEAFSVTPLEALFTRTPLVASDREFVRQISADIPYLTEPEDPVALARALVQAVSDGRGERTERGAAIAAQWPTARTRALRYLEIIDAALTRGD